MHGRALALALGATLVLTAACGGQEEPNDKPRPRAAATAPPPTATACAPTPGHTDGPVAAATTTPSRVRLGPGREVPATPATVAVSRTGEPLLLTGVVYAQDCRTPLTGATVEAWQTAADGRYGPLPAGSAERVCCYLYGTARTDSGGRYAFDTVVPGRYSGYDPPPRHVHVAVSHPLARSLTTEVMLAGDPGVRPDEPLAAPLTGREGARRLTFDLVVQDR